MPAVGQKTLVVDGVSELRRAFNRADKRLGRDLAKTLKEVGEPVREDAELRVIAGIPRIGFTWSRMRTGISRSIVYVAPQQRGRLTKRNPRRYARPNLADLMAPRMHEALAANTEEVERRFGRLLDDVGREWERG